MPIWTIILGVLAALLLIWAVISLFQGESFGFFFILAIAFAAGSVYSYQSYQADQFDRLSASEACVPSNARAVPSLATISTVKDDRVGLIYPCHYLLDQGIQAGIDKVVDPVPMRLQGNVSEKLFSDQNFTANGNLNGFLLLGSGLVSGNYNANQKTERTQMVAFMAETDYGFASFMVETGSVRYQECNSGCVPTVSIWTSGEPLFTKRKDESKDSSIWLMRDGRSNIASLSRDGAPASPGQTVQALATRIIVQLPPELMPSTANLGN